MKRYKMQEVFAGNRTIWQKRGKTIVAKGTRGSIVLNVTHNIGHMSYKRGEVSLVSKILESKMRRGGNRKSKSKAEGGNRREGRV